MMFCVAKNTRVNILNANPSGRAKVWVYGRTLAEIAGSNPAGGTIVVCCQAEFSATG
jgi:hypothetical protein